MNLDKLNREITKLKKQTKLNEFYEVEPGSNITMNLEYFGIHQGLKRFELDGIEFYQGEDEELDNAVEVCIDEEFLPDWQEKYDIDGYYIQNIDYEDGEDSGSVEVYVE